MTSKENGKKLGRLLPDHLGAKDLLYNLEVLRAWGESSQAIIQELNRKVPATARDPTEKQ